MERIHVHLDQLTVNPAINPRQQDADVSDIVASIRANGFTTPLVVRRRNNADGFDFEVIDGSRRLKALKLLGADEISLGPDGIAVDVVDADDTAARQMALALNWARLDLSPADEAVAFTALFTSGLDEGEIAKRFGVPKKLVRQRIAIGSLPALILGALRMQTISLDVAEAFTVSTSAERQLAVFADGKHLSAWSVHRDLTDKAVEVDDPRVSFVTLEAYRNAGGHVDEDLFDDMVFLTDVELLQKLFEDKITATTQSLKDAGWKWVKLLEGDAVRNFENKYPQQPPRGKREQTEDQKQSLAKMVEELKAISAEIKALEAIGDEQGSHTKEQLDHYEDLLAREDGLKETITAAQAKPYTPKQMAELGVLILLQRGAMAFSYGHQLAKDAGKQEKHQTPDPDEAPPEDGDEPLAPIKNETAGYSEALEVELLRVAVTATKLALISKPAMAYRLGLAARVSAFLNEVWVDGELDADLYPPFGTASVTCDDTGKLHTAQTSTAELFKGATSFADVFAKLETLTPEAVLEVEAVLASCQLSLTAIKNTDAAALIMLVDPDMRAGGFAPDEAFFARLSRDQLLLISAEIHEGNIIKKGKKPDMVQAILPQVQASGWLPPQLRTPSYEGPGSDAFEKLHAIEQPDPRQGDDVGVDGIDEKEAA